MSNSRNDSASLNGFSDHVSAASPSFWFEVRTSPTRISVLPGTHFLRTGVAATACATVAVVASMILRMPSAFVVAFSVLSVAGLWVIFYAMHRSEISRGPHLIIGNSIVQMRGGSAFPVRNIRAFTWVKVRGLRGEEWRSQYFVQMQLQDGLSTNVLECGSEREAVWLLEQLNRGIAGKKERKEENKREKDRHNR